MASTGSACPRWAVGKRRRFVHCGQGHEADVEARSILRAQAVYYMGTGTWAVVHRRSFEAVTGRKADYWLVRTVGLLAAAIGGSLLAAARRDRPSREAVVLAVAAGAAFSTVDMVGVASRTLRPVYLGDAALHLALAARAAERARQGRSPAAPA